MNHRSHNNRAQAQRKTMVAFGLLALLTVTFSAMSFRISGPSALSNPTLGPRLAPTSINIPFQHWDLREFPNCTVPWSAHDGTADIAMLQEFDVGIQNAFNTWQAVAPSPISFSREFNPLNAQCPLLFDGNNMIGWDGINCGMPSDDAWGLGIPGPQQVCLGTVAAGGIVIRGIDGWLLTFPNNCPFCTAGDDFNATIIATGQLVVADGGNGVIETIPTGDDIWDPAIAVAQQMCAGAVAANGIILRDPVGGDGNITPAQNCCDDTIVGGNIVDGGNGVITTTPSNGALASTTLGITAVFDNPNTGVILESDILFNDNAYMWQNVAHGARMNGNPDVEHIAAHEIGHFLGLHHPPGNGFSNPPGPMMNPFVQLSNDVWNAGIPVAQQGCGGAVAAGGVIMAVGANGVDVGAVNNCCDDQVITLVGGILGVADGGNGIVESIPAGDDLWNPAVPVASRVCYAAVPAGIVLYADGGAGGITPANNCCDDTIVGMNVVDGGDGRITTSLIPDPANHMLAADDMDGLNWIYTPDLGDAPDPWRGIFNQYQSKVHSSIPNRTLNGVQTFKPASGPYHLFGWPGTAPGNALFQFEFLGSLMDNSAMECEARVPDMDAFDDGVVAPAKLIKGAINRITVTVNTSGQPGRYDFTDPKKTLFMNAYHDFNDDCIFDFRDYFMYWEGTPESPPGMPGQCRTVAASANFVPPAIKVGNTCTLNFDLWVPPHAPLEFYCRYRLDFGEDEGRVQNISGDLAPAMGAAQFGEVEDYKCETKPIDQLHLLVPDPNVITSGQLAIIQAVVEADFDGAEGVDVLCTRSMGDFTFVSGDASPDGSSTVITTEEHGIALVEVLAGPNAGPALAEFAVGSDLQAFAIFNVVPNPLLGDTNGDGQTDVNDITYILFRLGSSDLSADADGDGQVNVNDLSFVLFRLGG